MDLKAQLHSYLQVTRGVVVAKCDGLSEYDVRRPVTVGDDAFWSSYVARIQAAADSFH